MVTELNFFLPMLPSGQHYWLNVTPVGNGTGRSFNCNDQRVARRGLTPGQRSEGVFNSTFFGYYLTSTSNVGQPYDYSMGVIGTVVPEPASAGLLTCGAGALLIALRCGHAA